MIFLPRRLIYQKEKFLFNIICNILNLSHFLSIMKVDKQRVLGL